MQQNSLAMTTDIYRDTVKALNEYFSDLCDATKERLKFREMRMKVAEPFADWVLRLQAQASLCEFRGEQREEEMLQAVTRRSIPAIADKLYEMANLFENKLEKVISHGKHLDFIRKEAEEVKSGEMDAGSRNATEEQHAGLRPVNAIRSVKQSGLRYRPYAERQYNGRSGGLQREAGRPNCPKCGRAHTWGQCKAFQAKCFSCGRTGHFASFCQTPGKKPGLEEIKREANRVNQLIAGEINQMITGFPKPPQFNCNSDGDPRLVHCVLGSERFTFLIDSGATVNTITTQGWQIIRQRCHTIVQDLTVHPEEVLKGYANQKPLDVVCSFSAYIAVEGIEKNMVLAKFFVVEGTKLSLLGYQTSHKLDLIHIGHPNQRGGYIHTVDSSVPAPGLMSDNEFPKLPLGGVRFKLDKTIIPRQIIRYNVPKAFEDAINKRLAEMEQKGIIERADKEGDTITFVSPMVLVPKGTKDFRIVIDYREVNKAIIREPYPMPSLEKIWTDIPHSNGCLIFTKLDLKDAYFHVELHEDVRHITTFMTANGLMRFRRLPFGLSCAPELFQRIMERILIHCKGIIVYLDDVLLFAPCKQELQKNVSEVKTLLRRHNLTVNEEKSSYNQTKVDFVGFSLDGKGILPTQGKISEIMQFERPKDVSEVRSFLGMLTFISPFIKNFSHMTKPLRDLLSRDAKFEWKEPQQNAFENLKISAEQDLVKRGFFKEGDQTILYTDASPWGLGAVLTQEDSIFGERRIIACASKSLTAVECRYPQLHREALAIIWAMERFAYYLLGRKFTLRSDSEALMFMMKTGQRKDVGKRIMSRAEGWFLRMEHFNYDFEHVAGKDNIADAASRMGEKRDDGQFGIEKEPHELCLVEADVNNINEQLLALTTVQVQDETLQDEELQTVMHWLDKNDKWPQSITKYQPFQNELYIQGRMLLKQEKIVLPKALCNRALMIAHRGHPGMSTMKNFLRQGLWWPGMDRDVESFVKSCPECQLVTKTSTPLPITLTELPKNPWEYISMDFASCSEVLSWKALVLVDNYSRYLVALPMEKTDTEAVKRALRRIFNTYHAPKTLKADNGPPFNSSELQSWLQLVWGVKLMHTTPLNPTENGLVERSMQGINKAVTVARLTKQNWKDALADYVAAYNSWPHHVTKVPPAQLMFGRAVRNLLPSINVDSARPQDEELRDRDKVAKFDRNAREDRKRRARASDIKVGDMVLMMQQRRDKTDTVYKNILYKVKELHGGRATIVDMTSNKEYERNVKMLKRYVRRFDEDQGQAEVQSDA
ncbi:uncharacterized protein K02A2.6-like [Anopheles ziemanni]|uniref:uncharacterized protein K02A2.6-like n=1 Tax=Anopheles coustani TaxID=139045 RepID=UPI00265AA460|nr:uncharacterized protein K02A2.6-like [Anopheles coustani]XP_058170296.1 uncharacterized protein K02A2.6-like [Anopheles ziemanni]